MIASVWVWPRLRVPRVWFGLGLAALIAATVWLAVDLHNFVEARGTSEKAAVRILYTLLSAQDLPVLPLVLGSFMTGLISVRRVRTAGSELPNTDSTEKPTAPKAIGEVG
jgi:hypothetical protein